jgi:hypothetical protein
MGAYRSAYRHSLRRRYRRVRYQLRGNNGGAWPAAVAAVVLFAAAGAGTKAASGSHGHAKAAGKAGSVTAAVAVTSGGETAFIAAALSDLGAPDSTGNRQSLAAWAAHEGPWGTVGQWNPLDSTLYEPGSTAFNTFGGGLHVWNYPDASAGAHATALTIEGYPQITAALRSGAGLCGNPALAGEFGKWSGNAYQEVC